MDMSDPAARQLDEISMKLGELTAYNHEHRHGVANLSMKMDGLSVDVSRQIAALEAKLTVRMEESHTGLSARIQALEAESHRRSGATSLVNVLLKSPALGWLVGAAISAWAILTGKVHV
jgi:hypothetical protein